MTRCLLTMVDCSLRYTESRQMLMIDSVSWIIRIVVLVCTNALSRASSLQASSSRSMAKASFNADRFEGSEGNELYLYISRRNLVEIS
jgi:hypothetical protein